MPNGNISRISFWDVFRLGQNETLITTVPIRIGAYRFEAGTVLDKGSSLGGIDFHQQMDRDIAVTISPSGLYIIEGFYLPE